jgi:hypothetical protein
MQWKIDLNIFPSHFHHKKQVHEQVFPISCEKFSEPSCDHLVLSIKFYVLSHVTFRS